MKYAFILNPAAGKGRDPAVFETAVQRVMDPSGFPYRLQRTERRGHAPELARAAQAEGFDVVVAIGGDGTVNEIARALIGSTVTLGLIPKGSGNGFAREFGIPLDPAAACRALLTARPLAIDVGRINDESFFNVAGFGLDAQIAWAFETSQAGGRRGIWPYVTSGIREFFRYRPTPVTLRHDGGETMVSPLLVAIANGKQYGSGAQIAPRAVINDGLLHLAVVEQAPWYRLLPALPKIFSGTFVDAPFLRTILTRRFSVEFSGDQPYHIDGEVRRAPALRADILPQALRFLTPPDYKP